MEGFRNPQKWRRVGRKVEDAGQEGSWGWKEEQGFRRCSRGMAAERGDSNGDGAAFLRGTKVATKRKTQSWTTTMEGLLWQPFFLAAICMQQMENDRVWGIEDSL